MRTLATLGLALLLGCASAPTAHQFNPSLTLEAPEEEAWDATIDAMAELNLSIDEMERASGFIGTDWASVPDSYLDCGSPGIATDRNHRGKFNIVVRDQDEGGTRITVNSSFQVTRTFSGNQSQVQCESTGVLEERMHRAVDSQLQ